MTILGIQSSIGTLFLGVFVLVGGGLTAFGLFNVWRGHASVGWPQVPGEVLHSKVVDNSDSDGNNYRPDVEYRYVVNGREFTGERVAFGLEHGVSNQQTVSNYVQRFRPGTLVSVFYQPGKPELSVLQTGVAKHTFVPVAFGLGLVGFALWFWLVFWLMAP